MLIDKIKLFVYDFDGVMTNNKVYVNQYGKEMVQVNRADGLGVEEIKKLGIEQIIISTEKNPIVSTRAKKLGIPCLQGIENKKDALVNYYRENNITSDKVAYVGNDINDKEAMETVSRSFCPADAHNDIKAISNYILKANGGDGVIREIYDIIIKEES